MSIQAVDTQGNVIAGVVWGLTDSSSGLFTIDPTTGTVRLSQANLDYEAATSQRIVVSVTEVRDGVTLIVSLPITIAVQNVLENLYLADSDTPNTLAENASTGTIPNGLDLYAVDERGELLSGVVWNITPADVFAIASATGVVALAKAGLDYESTPSYTIGIAGQVRTAEGVTLMSSLTVTIIVVDVLEAVRMFDAVPSTNTIPENASAGTRVSELDLQVVDEVDQPVSDVVFRIVSGDGSFTIASATGVVSLSTTASLDYAITSSYTVEVEAVGRKGGVRLSTTLSVTIVVLEALDNILSDADPSTDTIAENASTNTAVNGLVLQVLDDMNRTVAVTWDFIDNPDGLFVIGTTSGVVRLAKAELDYEAAVSYTLGIAAYIDDEVAGNILTVTVADIGSIRKLGCVGWCSCNKYNR